MAWLPQCSFGPCSRAWHWSAVSLDMAWRVRRIRAAAAGGNSQQRLRRQHALDTQALRSADTGCGAPLRPQGRRTQLPAIALWASAAGSSRASCCACAAPLRRNPPTGGHAAGKDADPQPELALRPAGGRAGIGPASVFGRAAQGRGLRGRGALHQLRQATLFFREVPCVLQASHPPCAAGSCWHSC